MKKSYIEECTIIRQNSTYTAEAHHLMAASAGRSAFALEVVPAMIAAITGAVASAGTEQSWLLPATVVSATVAAIAGVLSPRKTQQEHLAAAKEFMAMKHEARFLERARAETMADDAFEAAVQDLHERYIALAKVVPATDAKSFATARKTVQAGIHDPDKDSTDKIA